MNDRVHERVMEVAREIIDQPHETLVVFDAETGEVLHRGDGMRDKVTLPDDPRLRGAVHLHNHPDVEPPEGAENFAGHSVSDIGPMIAVDAAASYVADQRTGGVYLIERPGNGWDGGHPAVPVAGAMNSPIAPLVVPPMLLSLGFTPQSTDTEIRDTFLRQLGTEQKEVT